MRRALFASVLIIVLAGLGAPRDAQAQLLRLGVGGGPSVPVGDLGNLVSTGFHAQGMLALRVPLVPLSLRGDVLFQRMTGDLQGNHHQIGGVVNGVYAILPVPIVRPYLIGGLGVYHSRFGDEESSTGVGLNAGVGVRVNLVVVELFGETRFHNVFTDNGSLRTVPVTIGVVF